MAPTSYYDTLENYLITAVADDAAIIDKSAQAIRPHFEQLKALNTFKLLIPENYGGLGGELVDYCQNNYLISQYSAALCFLQSQQQAILVRLLALQAFSDNADFLTHLIKANKTTGIGNASNKNTVAVSEDSEYYYLTGKLFWVSGWQFFDYICVQVNHNNHYMGFFIPFNTEQHSNKISISEPMTTLAVNSVNTVQIELDHYPVLKSAIAFDVNKEQLSIPTLPAPHVFAGLAKALLNHIAKTPRMKIEAVATRHQHLTRRLATLNQYRINFENDKLTCLTQSYQLTEACTNLARWCEGGRIMLADNLVQRICHEFWMYTSAGFRDNFLDAYCGYADKIDNILEKGNLFG